MTIIYCCVSFFFGVIFGVFLMALMVAASRGDRR